MSLIFSSELRAAKKEIIMEIKHLMCQMNTVSSYVHEIFDKLSHL